jgi:hypothetical protein
VYQDYETRVGDEFVIIGNDVLIKCDVPSYAADYLQVVGWVTNNGIGITPLNGYGKRKRRREREREREIACKLIHFIISIC